MTSRTASKPRRDGGFTLVELMITVLLLAVVVISLTTVMWSASRSKTMTANGIEASEAGRVAIDMLARDLRSAGYGADRDNATPQRPIAYVDSLQVLINENLQPWPDTYGSPAQPLAYDPAKTPQPRPFVATEWTPPTQYAGGAETVRWTLDLTDDGAVNSDDQADPNAVDAQRTPNPDDFELVREVYGDNAGGSNGGAVQRVALVRRPGTGGIGPMFTVYLKGQTTPWNWSDGPVPANQLANIERIAVSITAPSGKKDWRGRYAQSTYRTQVSSMRNVPNSSDEYTVEGYVYVDSLPVNNFKDMGESPVPGARISIGLISTMTSASGYYNLRVPAGIHVIKQTPPPGYVNVNVPDTLSINVPPGGTRNFADQHLPGGRVRAFVFLDANNNGLQDVGEGGMQNVRVNLKPGIQYQYTNADGFTPAMFANVGACSLAVVPPDSFIVTTANPVPLSIVDGDTLTRTFGVCKPQVGTVSGKVFRDANRNGTYETGETGIEGVWVGVTTDGGLTVQGHANTDGNGNYSISVPANDPPRTAPYAVMVTPPTGYYPTGPTSIGGLYLQSGQTLSDRNFGMSSFTMIILQANRVLSLANGDLVENDWNGSHTENRHGDGDIVLGSDTGGTDQVSTWFNRYASTPLFATTPDYTRSAPGAVMAMSLDYLDVNAPLNRPDLVTGCKAATPGNFFVWWCQNTSGNEGYFPVSYSQAYKTQDQGDVQAVLTADLNGGTYPDILVGTRSPTAFTGSIELWTNSNTASPTFARTEVYPGAFLSAGSIGEVTAMVMGDLDGDGLGDLIVGSKRATGGQIYFFRNQGKASTPHFQLVTSWAFSNEPITALAITDVNGDGLLDLVAGSQTTADGGHLWQMNNGPGWSFALVRVINAPGIVTSIVAADLGGISRKDLAVGWHGSSTGYVGGVRIYYLDAGILPPTGIDPSAGQLQNWVPALTSGDFNYGSNPVASPPYLTDLAAGAKISANTGAVMVFIR